MCDVSVISTNLSFPNLSTVQLNPPQPTQSSMNFTVINKAMLVSFTTNVLGIIFILTSAIVPLKINATELKLFNHYPEYLWVYVLNFYTTPTVQVLAMLVLVSKSNQLLNYIKREITAFFFGWIPKDIKCRKTFFANFNYCPISFESIL